MLRDVSRRMYSSLGKVDIVVDGKGRNGSTLLVQTDHRDRDEVEHELETSVLFALARILSPLRMAEWKDATVRYVAIGELHPTLATVVASTGQVAESAGKEVDLSGIAKRAPADLANDAFVALGAKVMARERLSADSEGLAAFEKKVADARPDAEEDEAAYWTTVAELAAVTGEVLRAKYGGRWVADPDDFAQIPFMFEANATLLNAVSKAVKFIEHGERESPRQLAVMLEERGLPEGPILLNMKPASWAGRSKAVCEPLFPAMAKSGGDIPLVAYGRDQPQSFAMLSPSHDRAADLATLRAEALANLAKVEVSVEKVELDELTFWAVHGSFFAAEKILDMAFMKKMAAQIGSEMIMAAVPEKGRLFVMNAVVAPEQTLNFMALARGAYERNESGAPLSPTIFLVMDGAISGIATAGEPEKKKGFFARLFN